MDGVLDKNETRNMLKGQLGEQNCDSFKKLDSVLLHDNKDMFEKLKAMLKTYSSQNVRLELLFRASRDQCEPETFKEKVAGKRKTVTILTTHVGDIFGGYMDAAYDPSFNGYKADPKSFLFSLTKNEKYSIKNSDRAQFYDETNKRAILLFGGDDLTLESGCIGNSYNFGEDYQLP